jgi:hypothetical protein
VIWLRKSWTLKQCHEHIYSFYRKVFKNWSVYNKEKEQTRYPLSFNAEGDEMNPDWETFTARSLEDQYKTLFASMSPESYKEQEKDDKSGFHYNVLIKDIAGYYQNCFFCDQRSCRGCSLPFTEELTFKDML